MKVGVVPCLSAFLCLAGIANALIISQNTIDTSQNLNIPDGLTVDFGVYYSIQDGVLTSISGDVEISGSWYVTSTGTFASSVTQSGEDFYSYGLLSFNSINGLDSTYAIRVDNDFINEGQFYMGVGTQVADPFVITADHFLDNFGTMVFYSSAALNSPVTLTAGVNTLNEGSICMYNTFFRQNMEIFDEGCISLADTALFELRPQSFEFDTDQTIYLADPTARVSVTVLSLPLSNVDPYTVRGFGNRNVIASSVTITSFVYDSTSGILKLSSSGSDSGEFNIGTGYDQGLFQTGSFLSLPNAIRYNGPVPLGGAPPPVCSCSPDFPPPPLVSSSVSSSSSSSSSTPSSSSSRSSSSSVTSSSNSASSESSTTSESSTVSASSEYSVSSSSPTSSFSSSAYSSSTSDSSESSATSESSTVSGSSESSASSKSSSASASKSLSSGTNSASTTLGQSSAISSGPAQTFGPASLLS